MVKCADYFRGSIWKESARRLLAHDGMETAGFLSYTVLVSAFPFLIFLFSIASLFSGDDALRQLIGEGLDALPVQVNETISPVIRDVLARPRPGLLTIGLIGALWAASSGVDALRHALNRAYEASESRPWWRRRLDSALAIFAAAISGFLVAFGLIVLPLLIQWVGTWVPLPLELIYGLTITRFLLVFTLLTALFWAMYRYLPTFAARHIRAMPGALLASSLWTALATSFSFYLSFFNNYSATYGSLGGIVITLLFLQLSAAVLLFGAEFNACLHKRNT